MFRGAVQIFALGALTCFFAGKGEAQLLVPSPFGGHTVSRAREIAPPARTVNGASAISAPSGTDISSEVSAALLAAKSTCGTVTIAPGLYAWNTAGVQMLPCETLTGAGATIFVNVGGVNAPPFLIVKGPGPVVPDRPADTILTVGNIRGITFIGPSSTPDSQSSSIGIELGGATSAETAQLINLYDVHIRNFGCGLNIQWAFQVAVFGGSIEGNYDGVCFANIITFLENINFHGTQILNNVDYGINQNQVGANVELNLISCSLDDNGQYQPGGQVQIANGKLNILGGHFESDRAPMIAIPVPGAPAIATIYVTGTTFNLTETRPSYAYASFFSVKGVNSVLEIGRGVSFSSQGAAVSAVADWAPIVNQNSRLLMDPYTYIVSTAPRALPAFVGTVPNNYHFANYDAYDNVTGISSSY